MKLVRKLTIILILGVMSVLVGYTYVRWHRESELFDSDTRRDHRTLGVTLAVAVAQTWERAGEQAALSLVRHVNTSRDKVAIRWVVLEPSVRPDLAPVIAGVAMSGLGEVPIYQTTRRERPDHPHGAEEDWLYTYVAAPVPGYPGGAIELRESLESKTTYLADTVRNALLASLAVVLVAGLLALLIGSHLVGRPVTRLIAQARRIGAGDFSDSLRLTQRDELGELAEEIELMSRRLDEAQQQAQDENQNRIAMLEQLRHAERLTHVGRLASALAHEVGTPLNVVAGHAQMIAKGRVTGQDATESARVIAAQCERMTRIVRQILDYARRRPAKTLSADLRDVAHGTVELLSSLASRREVRLASTLEDSSPAEVDASQIQQALINLIMNAVHVSPPGSVVEVVLERREARRRAENSPAQDYYVLSVIDHGEGVSEQHQARLFEPFFTTKPSGEGTGLGLSITKDIVEEHGGWIEFESTVGVGSRFDLYLPTSARATKSEPPCQSLS